MNDLLPVAPLRRRPAVRLPRRLALPCLALLLCIACGGGHSKPPPASALATLPTITLTPADLNNAYRVQIDGYLDDDAQPVQGPTKQYRRTLQKNSGVDEPADVIVVTIADDGLDAASDFIDSASDHDTGPPNLQDYVASVVPGATDVHATPDDDFPTSDDATVANQLTWQQDVNGAPENEYAYGVYVRQEGLLAFVAVRAVTRNGGEPDGLRKQAEDVVKKQADKLKQGAMALGSAAR